MEIPSSLGQIAAYALLLLPGVTFATVRTALVGFRSPDFSVAARILEAVFVSMILDTIYVFIYLAFASKTVAQLLVELGPMDSTVPGWVVFLLGLVGLIIIPALLSFGFHARIRLVEVTRARGKKQGLVRRVPRVLNTYRSTPTAWDHVALETVSSRFVRVRAEDGSYYGGWFSTASFMSTHPQPRDIYIEAEWNMAKNGEFLSEVVLTRGVWLPVGPSAVVQWFDRPERQEPE